jgi:hypothetical protein
LSSEKAPPDAELGACGAAAATTTSLPPPAAGSDAFRSISRPPSGQLKPRSASVTAAVTLSLRTLLVVMLPVAAIPRLWAAIVDHGIYWPDEIYQVTEPAHRLAFGYGFTSWEFHNGARSWALPGILAGVLRIEDALGARSGLALMTGIQLLTAVLGIVTVGAVMVFAWRRGGGTASAIAGILALAFPMFLVLEHHPLSESFATPLVAIAVALLVDPTASPKAARIAGALACAATVLRYELVILLVGFFVILLVRADRRPAWNYAAAAGVVAMVPFVLDWATFGYPFAATIRNITYNLDIGTRFGTSSWNYYFTTLWSANGVLVLLILVGSVLAYRKEPAFVVLVGGFVLAHCAIPHKELRFLLPVAPLAVGLAGIGLGDVLDNLCSRAHRRDSRTMRAGLVIAVTVAFLVLPVVFGVQSAHATLAAFGVVTPGTPNESVWHSTEGWNVLASQAGKRNDLCGLATTPLQTIATGGYTYIHRDVPVFALHTRQPTDIQRERAGANYLIAKKQLPIPTGYRVIARSRGYLLTKRNGGCGRPPPWYHTHRTFPIPGSPRRGQDHPTPPLNSQTPTREGAPE